VSVPYTSELAAALAEDALARLDRYTRVDTQSAREHDGTPSTPGQLDLSRLLVSELQELGLSDAAMDEHGYVMATLPGSGPTIGLISHVDVSPDAPGFGVQPLVHREYDGGTIALPRGGTVVEPGAAYAGDTIMTSSGDTLLGADDKAGVAEIMAAVAHLAAHPELPRPTIRVGFTPDEEIGEGALHFDIERFGAQCAYTIDGSDLGELQDETFTAAGVTVEITGVDIHPGFATGKMVNALRAAGRILAALPPELSPERTSGRDGFVHPYSVTGDAAHATIGLIARDFEDDKLAEHVALVERVAREQAQDAKVVVTSRAQYPNMRDHLKPFPEIVEHAERAIRAEGLEPVRTPIRGGTDGSILSARGLPTPNLFTGGHEYHSVREWASLREMAAAAATIVRLAGEWAA
jgi:tripeptide aminopeptidase